MTRRTFLAAGTGAAVLAACGGDGSSSTQTLSASGTGPYDLGARFAPGTHVAGVPQRVPFVLVNPDGSAVSVGPMSFTAQLSLDGVAKGAPITFTRHQQDIPAPYWLATTTFDEPGTWDINASFSSGPAAKKSISVLGRDMNVIPTIGDKLTGLDTPTTTADLGVNPICTAQPQCPLHVVSLAQAMTTGKPVALLIGTPAYCQTGICGPVLDLLVASQAAFPNVQMIHAEVYTKAYTGPDTPVTPAVESYNLPFEPYLVIADSTGMIVARFDSIWDSGELEGGLALAV
ncbi:MAG: hypothetical protein AB7V43_09210 [Acidimicrobiia bacterium]